MVSVIMPAYNEAGMIRTSIAEAKLLFHTLCPDYEIIVVDDGSTDGTGEVVRSMKDKRVKLVSYPNNQGKGHALKAGFARVEGEFTFLMDSDSEIWPRDLAMFMKALRTADIAIGSKRHPLSIVSTPVPRKFLSAGLHVLVRLLTGVKITDTQAGFKAAKSSVVSRILPRITVKKFAFDLEFLVVASLLHAKLVELPIRIELRALAPPKRVFRTLIDILGIAYRLRIRKWYQENIASNISRTYNPILRW